MSNTPPPLVPGILGRFVVELTPRYMAVLPAKSLTARTGHLCFKLLMLYLFNKDPYKTRQDKIYFESARHIT